MHHVGCGSQMFEITLVDLQLWRSEQEQESAQFSKLSAFSVHAKCPSTSPAQLLPSKGQIMKH